MAGGGSQSARNTGGPPRMAVSRTRAEEVIHRHVVEGMALQADSDQVVTDEDYDIWSERRERWVSLTGEGLRSIYTNDEPRQEFEEMSRPAFPMVIRGAITAAERFKWAREAVARGVNTLTSLRERLEYLEAPEEAPVPADGADSDSNGDGERRIFLVHGHSAEAKESTVRLLEITGDHAIVILHEQPSEGRTLIEKFEDHATASDHAVVLLTADDVGGVAPGGGAPELHPRARQNVVFELGFFVGRLGRARVTVLYEHAVELPSDFKGVVYISLGDDSWRYKLLKELRNAGLMYDLNKIPT